MIEKNFFGISRYFVQISFPSVKYDDAGIYVCSVTHNGMTRYVRAFAMCVQSKSKKGFIIVK